MLKAKPIFSPRFMLSVVNHIKEIDLDLWESWKKIECSNSNDDKTKEEYSYIISRIDAIIIKMKVTNDMEELTNIIWNIRIIMRVEAGLPIVPRFDRENIKSMARMIEEDFPELWKEWGDLEKIKLSYAPIRSKLVDMVKYYTGDVGSVMINSAINDLRMHVLISVGIWLDTDVSL